MGKPAQTGLHAANHQRNIRIGLPHQLTIHIHRMVRPQALLPAGRINIIAAGLFGRCVVIHHRINIAAAHQKRITGPTKSHHTLAARHIRLGNNPYTKAFLLQQPRHQSRAKAGMIHIGIP